MQEWIAIAALAVAIGTLLMNLLRGGNSEIWRLSDRLNKMERDREENRRLLYLYVEEKHEEVQRQFGETVHAYAEHGRQLEVDLYKNFVRLPAFEAAIKFMTDNINIRFDKLEERLDRVDRKF